MRLSQRTGCKLLLGGVMRPHVKLAADLLGESARGKKRLRRTDGAREAAAVVVFLAGVDKALALALQFLCFTGRVDLKWLRSGERGPAVPGVLSCWPGLGKKVNKLRDLGLDFKMVVPRCPGRARKPSEGGYCGSSSATILERAPAFTVSCLLHEENPFFRSSIWCFPGARGWSIGVVPRKSPSTYTSAPGGVDSIVNAPGGSAAGTCAAIGPLGSLGLTGSAVEGAFRRAKRVERFCAIHASTWFARWPAAPVHRAPWLPVIGTA